MSIMCRSVARLLGALALAWGISGAGATAALAAPPQAAAPKATRAEYDAFNAAAAEKNPQQKIKMLDDFVAKYPNSEYMPYVYSQYWPTYASLQQWVKVIEYLDKLIALPAAGDGVRLDAYYRRAATFDYAYNAKSPDLAQAATKGRDAALEGLKALDAFKKPEQMKDDQWAAAKKQYTLQFNNTAASASYYLKDYKAVVDYYQKALALDPNQPGDDYRMGVADLLLSPPQSVAGFWALARAIDLKIPDADKITKFLHDKIFEYQQPGCDGSVDAQVTELLTLAQSSPDPPAGYSLPSAAELAKVRETEVPALIAQLKGGGDKGKMAWLAVCNGVFPEAFLAKTYEVNAANTAAIELKAAIGSTEDEVNASTAADTTLKITTQPEAARLSKDDIFRFAGKLTGYTPTPFQLTFEDVKINPEDIPAEKGKAAPKRPGKKPGK
jgi:tetratricopeptide (TPR) repeat protein